MAILQNKGVFLLRKCQNCNMPFSWSEIYKAFLGWVYKPVKCVNCGAEHEITILGRLIFVSLTALPMLLFVIFFSPFNNLFATLGVGLAILSIGSLFVPYFVEFKVV
ncbi:TIGR04104 family putative zinc finger protein [Sporosarcina sp. A2]|uniref:TIGR04104 family putative zinc finger protein n=1 Tax=Sporosarcina sp. A2 TaxID=3393449 RepID=UPI003D7995F9